MAKQKEVVAMVPIDTHISSNTFDVEKLISKAIDNNIPVDTMERLLAMRKDLKSEWAKEEFGKAMAKFQADCPTIQKTKEVKTRSGEVAYRYAPIESIVDQVKEVLQGNGFSYSTGMIMLDHGVEVSVKVTHIGGHTEITKMTVPLGNKTQVMSDSQVVAAASTFAKRYAFCNAFGILTGDEDNDAQDIQDNKTVSNPDSLKPQFVYTAPSRAAAPVIKKDRTNYQEILALIAEAKSNKNLNTIVGILQLSGDLNDSEKEIIKQKFNEKKELFKIGDNIN